MGMHSQYFIIAKVKALKRHNSWKRIPLLIGSGAKTSIRHRSPDHHKSYKFTRVWPSYNVAPIATNRIFCSSRAQ